MQSSGIVSPGGKVWKMCPRYETSRYEKSFYKVWNFCIGVWKKFLRYENKNLKVRGWNWFLRVWKIFWQGMKLLYKGMKKVFIFLRVWNNFRGYEKVPFGYEKNPIFAKKYFHTLGYENIGCFSLMPNTYPRTYHTPYSRTYTHRGWVPRESTQEKIGCRSPEVVGGQTRSKGLPTDPRAQPAGGRDNGPPRRLEFGW